MTKNEYLENLSQTLIENGKGKKFIDVCLRYASKLIDMNLPVIFDTKHLSLLIGISNIELFRMLRCNELYYSIKTIPKKSGGMRKLIIPSMSLKYIQRWILDNILNNIRVSEHATGFCKNKSIVTNAKLHVSNDCVMTFDLEDFFPSINFETIFKIFNHYGYTKEVSFVLAKLCTFEDILPQGSPASPYLSNIVCNRLDKRLSMLAKTYNANYSRYADDITISGKFSIQNIKSTIEIIVCEENFKINNNKTRVSYKHQKQEVAGLIVNCGNVTVEKKYRKKLMQEIYYCKKYGVENHMSRIGLAKSFYKEHLYGKAYFINMVNPVDGKKILDLLSQIEWDY